MTRPEDTRRLSVVNLEALREQGWAVVNALELEHLQAIADLVAHFVRLGLVELQDGELWEHLVGLGLLDVEQDQAWGTVPPPGPPEMTTNDDSKRHPLPTLRPGPRLDDLG